MLKEDKSVDEVMRLLEDTIDRNGFVDIGPGTQTHFDCSTYALRVAVRRLTEQGFKSQTHDVHQLATNDFVKVTIMYNSEEPEGQVVFDLVNKNREKSVSEKRAATIEDIKAQHEGLVERAYAFADKGLSQRQIGVTLGISPSTVRTIISGRFPNGPETSELERELASVLNKYSAENESNTPDFILAEYLMACLKAFNTANNSTKAFHSTGKVLNVD